MASILNEYLNRNLNFIQLNQELDTLIARYNNHTNRYLMLFVSDVNKVKIGIQDIALDQDDFYNIQDILRESDKNVIDIYLETPGGSGEAAEEIARFLHKKFEIDKDLNFTCDNCNFVIDLRPIKSNIEQIEKKVLLLN